MKSKCAAGFSVLAFSMILGAFVADVHAAFKHPGMFNSQKSLDFIKGKIKAKQEPWFTAWKEMLANKFSSMDSVPKPVATIEVHTDNQNNFINSGHMAYSQAIQWAVTGDARHREKVITIINAWVNTCKKIVNRHKYAGQMALYSSKYSILYLNAAEIITYYNAPNGNWSGAAKFRQWVNKVIWPAVSYFSASCSGWGSAGCAYTDSPEFSSLSKRASNQEMIYGLAMMCIGVFQEDNSKYKRGKDLVLWALPRYFYPSGQAGESCRDPNHASMGIVSCIEAAQVDYLQGYDDIFTKKIGGDKIPRLAVGLEWAAAARTPGKMVTAVCRGKSMKMEWSTFYKYPGWEIALSYYANSGVAVPNLRALVIDHRRPEPYFWGHPNWTSVTHADLPDFSKPVSLASVKGYQGSNIRNRNGNGCHAIIAGSTVPAAGTFVDIRGRRIMHGSGRSRIFIYPR